MKKNTRLICIALIIFVTLTSCQSTKIPQQVISEKKRNESQNEVIIRLGWWGSEERHNSILNGLQSYMREHHDIKLIGEYSDWNSYYQRLVTQLTGGNAPDIIAIDASWLNDLEAQGEMFEDLYNHKDRLDFNKLDMELLKNYTEKDGHLLGIPLGLNASTIIYNNRIVNMTGISLNEDSSWNWEILLNEGKRFKESYPDLTFLNTDLFSLELFILRPYVIGKTGNQWIKEDYTLGFDKQALTEGFTYIKQLFDNKLIENMGEMISYNGKIGTNPQWLNGKCALTLGWASDIPALTNPNVEIKVAQFPIVKDTEEMGIYTKPNIVISINKKSSHIDENIKFLSWLINNQHIIPYLYNANEKRYTIKNKQFQHIEEYMIDYNVGKALRIALKKPVVSENGISSNSELKAITYDSILKVAYGRLTPEYAADVLITQFNEKLQELRDNRR